ncbi:MAG: phosphopantetheine-binding protein [Oscillospiraceae bacterium]|nr:phosphopantetheine-binding protein [Oscillospiraceae bacterium]MCC8090311.1 phosphopantetheine-binding protein [Oscillospiraceae bacterium]MCD7743196.1 phosphopantetheine-binding protein [Oscillospiraceae bacterium]MCD7767472.1 phosphopantetheine-binding protein [Oscillospiraceae bacterium]
MVFQTIVEVIAERYDLDAAKITPETSLHDLGIDSLDTVEMLMELGDRLGVELELEEKVETVGALSALIESKCNAG